MTSLYHLPIFEGYDTNENQQKKRTKALLGICQIYQRNISTFIILFFPGRREEESIHTTCSHVRMEVTAV